MDKFHTKNILSAAILASLLATSAVNAEPKRLAPSSPEAITFLGQYPGGTARLGQFVVSGGPEGDSAPVAGSPTLQNNGHVYLWDSNSSAPGVLYRLSQAQLNAAPNPSWLTSKQFSDLGRAVAINSNWIAATAPHFNYTGAVFFIPKQGSVYAPQFDAQPLLPPNNDTLGENLALSQNYLVISSLDANFAGNVHIYTRINNQWALVKSILGQGKNVSISPDDQSIVITGPNGTQFYSKIANQHNWNLVSTLPYYADRSDAYPACGSCIQLPTLDLANKSDKTRVDIDNSSAVISYGDGIRFFNKNTNGSWQLTNEHSYQYNYAIGGRVSVSISGDYALLGLPAANTAYVFQRKDINHNGVIKKEWLEVNNFSYIGARRVPGSTSDADLDNSFASSVDISNNQVAISASHFWEKVYGGDQLVGTGTAYAFDIADITSGAPLKAGNNLLKNGNFSSGLNNWSLLNNNGGNSSHSVVNNALKVIITNPGSIFWSVQEVQSVSTLKGAYELSAKVISQKTESNMVLNVGKGYGDYLSYCRKENVRITTAVVTPLPEVFCDSIPQDSNMRVDLNLGAQGTNTVTIDDAYFGPARIAGTSGYGPLMSSLNGGSCYDQEVMPTGAIEAMINTKIIAKTCNGSSSQQFTFTSYFLDFSNPSLNGFHIRNKNGQYCLTKADTSNDVVWKTCGGSVANYSRNLWTTEGGRLHWATDSTLCATNSNGLNFVLASCHAGGDTAWIKPIVASPL